MDPYQTLATILISICPPESDHIRLNAGVDEGWASLDLRCRKGQGPEHRPRLDGLSMEKMYDNLALIRTALAANGGEKFSSCVFTIQDGKFDLQVAYADSPNPA